MLHIQRFIFNPFSENTYLVYNDDKSAWLVDPGNQTPRETQQLQDFITAQNLTLEKILLTHAHIDHILGLQWAYDTFNLPVHLHPLEEEILKLGKWSAQQFGFDFEDFRGETVSVEEGDELKLGEEVFKIYFTPGHSPGHIVYHNASNKFMLSGDVLFDGSIGRTDLYKGDFNLLIKSIREKIMPHDEATIILSGHGKETTIGKEKHSNPFL